MLKGKLRPSPLWLPFLYQTKTIQQRSFAKQTALASGESNVWQSVLDTLDKIDTQKPNGRFRRVAAEQDRPAEHRPSLKNDGYSDDDGGAEERPFRNAMPPEFRVAERPVPAWPSADRAGERSMSGRLPMSRARGRPSARPPADHDEQHLEHIRIPGPREGGVGYGQIADYVGAVPFETAESIPFAKKEHGTDSTVTYQEFRSFQDLLALKKHDQANEVKAGEKEAKEPLDDLISRILKLPVSTAADKSDQLKSADTPKSAEDNRLEQKYGGEIRRVNSLMQDAKDDASLWQLLREHAFAPVIALDLDAKGSTPNMLTDSKAKKTSSFEKALSKHSAASKDKHEVLKGLVYTFPRHLINFQKIARATFPFSLYSLTLLPYLKQLGDTAFALGATTELYNDHIRSLYRQFQDLQGVYDTVVDMDRHFVGFDHKTLDLVDKYLNDAQQSAANLRGESKYALWKTDNSARLIENLTAWTTKIRESLREMALDNARLHPGRHTNDMQALDG